MSIFEVIMLVCFGAAWPPSIYKSYVSRTAQGKSVIFLVIVLAGYCAGVLHKLFFSFDWVILLYLFNGLMVASDILLYIRNVRFDRRAAGQDTRSPARGTAGPGA
ncbi:MAG: hypothetical protein ACOX3E_08285 [Desulfomonilia bacterium]|jgi:hypothetical protein|uniref:PQ loop repeat protein n=1 Tax=anaerobic digester metagenome TaxID=1263854 RepID=A0A485M1D8_9ZZZZ|nr:hypothetical protein [Pseudomonadota bacterium]HON39029.1 hypothetical protein [Deltaproteobacteria bacterium]HRS56014.1 hypothetical protein [Desulfomonilia bacterium]HPD21348.1 hypothetical protein [Deltaproteobacteria bacterium]HPX19662.1 hypothetical protein [Deltaproteobacteria bacterium]